MKFYHINIPRPAMWQSNSLHSYQQEVWNNLPQFCKRQWAWQRWSKGFLGTLLWELEITLPNKNKIASLSGFSEHFHNYKASYIFKGGIVVCIFYTAFVDYWKISSVWNVRWPKIVRFWMFKPAYGLQNILQNSHPDFVLTPVSVCAIKASP